MIDRCFNPACKKRLRYLRDGRVIRVIQNQNGQLRVEHFWLCGPCYTLYDFAFSEEGTAFLKARPSKCERRGCPGNGTEITDAEIDGTIEAEFGSQIAASVGADLTDPSVLKAC